MVQPPTTMPQSDSELSTLGVSATGRISPIHMQVLVTPNKPVEEQNIDPDRLTVSFRSGTDQRIGNLTSQATTVSHPIGLDHLHQGPTTVIHPIKVRLSLSSQLNLYRPKAFMWLIFFNVASVASLFIVIITFQLLLSLAAAEILLN